MRAILEGALESERKGLLSLWRELENIYRRWCWHSVLKDSVVKDGREFTGQMREKGRGNSMFEESIKQHASFRSTLQVVQKAELGGRS